MADPLKVLFVASECAPVAKAGGLGDVVGALPKALRKLGIDARILLPRYRFISSFGMNRHIEPFAVPIGNGEAWCALFETKLVDSDVPLYFIEHDAAFDRDYIYDPKGGYAHDNCARFALLSRGAFMVSRLLEWIPDVIHAHDWPSASAPIMLNTCEKNETFAKTASVLTIHNIAHQPRFPLSDLPLLQVGREAYRSDGLEDHGAINVFKGGLYHATMLTTVSPRYAQEIRTPSGGMGLDALMRFRGGDLLGILNGIDEELWNPETDRHIPANYSYKDLSGKAECKRRLQAEMHFPQRPDVPLIGMVSRLTKQKGTDVILEVLDELLALDVQIVMLGGGDRAMEEVMRMRSHWGGDRFRAWIGHNEPLSHKIEAASDLFLMPSRFEPCGLNQMYSMRYGTLPIVRAVGGLDDTVENFDEKTGGGTGFKLWDLSHKSLIDTVHWATLVYRNRPELFRRMQLRAMQKDFSWHNAAQSYADVYAWAVQKKRGTAFSVGTTAKPPLVPRNARN
jgi:starch synthase